MKYLLIAGLVLLSLPFWLPKALGGDTAFFFVMTGSMRGTADPGAFVVVRRQSHYAIGDVVAFRRDLAGDEQMTVIHRIIGSLPDGRFVIKGDATDVLEEVEQDHIMGRMAGVVPWVGFLPGAFRHSPLLIGGLLLGLFLVGGRAGGASIGRSSSSSLFAPALLFALLSFPFASIGVAALLGKFTAYGLLLTVLGVTRYLEVRGVHPKAEVLLTLNYVGLIIMSVSAVSVPDVIQSVNAVFPLRL